MKVIVVGAGIGGLTAHRVCKKAGLARSRKKLETLLAAEPEAYKELFATIRASSVAETMRAQELEEGPFG